MKREIKFRAWDKDAGKMLYANNGLFMFIGLGVLGWNMGDDYQILEDQNQYELMQYTGLKDKNGKEIYEGEVWECASFKTRAVVVFHECRFCLKWFDGTMGDLHTNVIFDKKSGFIGNIYENPELINNQKQTA